MRLTLKSGCVLLFVASLAGCNNTTAPRLPIHTEQNAQPPIARPIHQTGLDFYKTLMFKEVQLAGIFADSKTFVDAIPKAPLADIAAEYQRQKEQPGFALAAFVKTYFDLPQNPAANFRSDKNQPLEAHIELLWDVLTRQPDDESQGTLIPLPNAYVVPGGRFREVYYWDSYFTMLGLRASGRWDLIAGMVNNFSYLIDKLGFIPNGNRNYYQGRSQPPFYSLMVELLAEHQGRQILPQYLPYLLKEYQFWMDGSDALTAAAPAHRRVVLMPNGARLNRYWDDIAAPRPESFKEDYELAEKVSGNKREFYRNLRAAAESGWDFSSRWFADGKNLASINTTEIIPVDLNSLLYHLEQLIAQIYHQQGDEIHAQKFAALAAARKTALIHYAWNPAAGIFHDVNFVQQQQTSVESLATVFPLYFGLASQAQADAVADKLQRDFLQAGGLTTTLSRTGQQWDIPNGWAPVQWLAIQALRRYGHGELASEIKKRWVDLNLSVYQQSGKLVEKYNVYDTHIPGGGGEYELQDGFGWTNGVLLDLLRE